jgi:hypothetical protein
MLRAPILSTAGRQESRYFGSNRLHPEAHAPSASSMIRLIVRAQRPH